MSQIKDIFISLRPHQWTKNLLVFAALIFSGHLLDFYYFSSAVLIFIYYSITAGSLYIINDFTDRKEDINHPEKRNRPIAAGKLSIPIALFIAVCLILLALVGSFGINRMTGLVLLTYLVLTLLYSLKLKHVVILDILVVATGFVLRAVAGAVAIEVHISSWLLVCTFFLALLLVIGKRRQELILLEDNAVSHRKILDEYNEKVLDQMIAVVTAITIVAYALYTLDTSTIERFNTEKLIYTIPLVIFGLFRYFYLIYKKNLGGSPERILLTDKGILGTVLIWIALTGVIIY